MDNKNFTVDFFSLGFPKCGTTHIANMLRQHPEIFIPEKKELNGFMYRHALGWENESKIKKK